MDDHAPDASLRVTYSTAAPAAVAAFAADRYALRGPLECGLLNRGFNDTFTVATVDGERFVLRVSSRNRRDASDVAAETAFLAYLDAAGVPVAAPVPTRGGALFTEFRQPEGPRLAALFRYVGGRPPGLDAPNDALAQGVTLARIHAAAEGFAGRMAGRRRLDLEHLVRRPLARVSALPALSAEARAYLTGLAGRLSEAVTGSAGLSRTRGHGDCHGLNARIVSHGPGRDRAVLFDFDDGGYGYLAYDLAVHLWAQVSFQRRRYVPWHAFIDGYRSVRPITPADFEAIRLFVPIRHLWLLGEYARRTPEWGCDHLSPAWLDRQADFLRTWEAERLGPLLV